MEFLVFLGGNLVVSAIMYSLGFYIGRRSRVEPVPKFRRSNIPVSTARPNQPRENSLDTRSRVTKARMNRIDFKKK